MNQKECGASESLAGDRKNVEALCPIIPKAESSEPETTFIPLLL